MHEIWMLWTIHQVTNWEKNINLRFLRIVASPVVLYTYNYSIFSIIIEQNFFLDTPQRYFNIMVDSHKLPICTRPDHRWAAPEGLRGLQVGLQKCFLLKGETRNAYEYSTKRRRRGVDLRVKGFTFLKEYCRSLSAYHKCRPKHIIQVCYIQL